MSTKEGGVGYDEGYMKGWNDAMDEKPAEASEPVAYIEHHKGGDNLVWDNPGANSSALYTSPPAGARTEDGCYAASKPWVSLTDEEFQLIYDNGRTPAGMMELVEAKLREKNEHREKNA